MSQGPADGRMVVVNAVISWLRAPVSVSLALPWRLRLYGVCLVLVALSVPFVHLYLDLQLSLVELAVHALDVTLGTSSILVVGEIGLSLWQRSTTWQLDVSRGALAAFLVMATAASISMQSAFHDVLPMTGAIRDKHVHAGYQDMSLRILPLIVLIGWLVAQLVREQSLRAELAELKSLNQALEQAHSAGGPRASCVDEVSFRYEGQDVSLDAATIDWLAAEENYCRIHTLDRQLLVRTTLLEALDKLPARLFLRVHRSHVIGLLHVTQVRRAGRRYAVVLGTGATVPVSRSHVADVRARLGAAVA